MKKVLLSSALILLLTYSSYSNISMLTCTAGGGTTIQVYLNGKLINKKPNHVVRLKSKDGCNSLSLIVHSGTGSESFTVQRDVDIESGYEMYFNVTFDDCGPRLILSRRYPLLNTYSYNKKLYALQLIS